MHNCTNVLLQNVLSPRQAKSPDFVVHQILSLLCCFSEGARLPRGLCAAAE